MGAILRGKSIDLFSIKRLDETLPMNFLKSIFCCDKYLLYERFGLIGPFSFSPAASV